MYWKILRKSYIVFSFLLSSCQQQHSVEQELQQLSAQIKTQVIAEIDPLPLQKKTVKIADKAPNKNPFVIQTKPSVESDNGISVMQVNSQQLLSVNYQSISVTELLQKIAHIAHINLIISNTVVGSMCLHIDQLPCSQIIDIILQAQGLGKRCIGNVYLIASLGEIAAHNKQNLEAQQLLANLAPLQSELIQIRYGKAADIVTMLKGQGSSLLSERGTVSADTRTNTVWIEEVPQKIDSIRHLIQQLDIPVRQILIEARIVNIDCNYERDLGVRFGITDGNHVSGTLAGANQLASGVAPADVPLASRLNMDLPAVPSGGVSPVSVGLALAHLGKGTLLDLELSALESEGGGKIISKPQLITADQQAAQIAAGEEIPYQQSTSSGATNVSFKAVVLKLNVLPQITPDGHIILTLKINQDKVGNRLVQGTPSIDTREIETQVLVGNGETVVLGGIYETDTRNHVQRVPLLGTLPWIGGLFRYNQISNLRQELLIFITPHILSQGKEGI